MRSTSEVIIRYLIPGIIYRGNAKMSPLNVHAFTILIAHVEHVYLLYWYKKCAKAGSISNFRKVNNIVFGIFFAWFKNNMNPPDEIPQSSVNGQTRTVEQNAARPNTKPKPRKGN